MRNTWEIVADLVSAIEANEVKSMLGVQVIDKLMDLSSEYSNLEDILLDIGPLPTNLGPRLKVKKLDDRIRFVHGIREYLNVERIHEVKEDIVGRLNDELCYIEEDIAVLYSFIEKQADRMMQGSNYDTKGGGLCCSCGTPRQISKETKVSVSTSLLASSSTSALSTNSLTDYCINCKLKRERRDKKLTDKLPKRAINRSTDALAPSNDPIDSHNSKTRNKLQAAKDELYFLEEDL